MLPDKLKNAGPIIAAVIMYGSIWAFAGLPAASWFSVGFIVATVYAVYETGLRKSRTQNTPE